MDRYERTLADLQMLIEAQDFRGYDPYDVLKSPIPFNWLGKWGPVFAIQFMKRSPVNLRPLLGVRKGENPKGLGLLLQAYSKQEDPDIRILEDLFHRLIRLKSKDALGFGWGYDFPWASPVKYLPAWSPTIVVTGFIAQGVHAYYELSEDPKAREVLDGISEFILSLPRSEFPEGLCFSYSTKMQDVCFNASMLGAEHFARMHALTGDASFKDLALSSSAFTVFHQLENCAWPYSLDDNGKARMQIDFHQGFVLCSLNEVMRKVEDHPVEWSQNLQHGLEFYKKQQFTPEGRSLWRWPKKWPTDIHHQAQGIITFARLGDLEFAEKIARWTLDNMLGKDGSFFYRIHRTTKDKTRYMRWGQAWMLLALTELINARNK